MRRSPTAIAARSACSRTAATPRVCEFLEDQVLIHLVSPDEVAAVLVEPIQGEGGYVVPPAAFHQRLRELTTKHGMLLMADEVQSGMGRTGKMFAIEHFGVEPDVVAVAQGRRVGPAARGDDRALGDDGLAAGAHASTFGGNPVSCACGAGDDHALEGYADGERRRSGRAHDRRASGAAEQARHHRRRAWEGADDRHRAGQGSQDEGTRDQGARSTRRTSAFGAACSCSAPDAMRCACRRRSS